MFLLIDLTTGEGRVVDNFNTSHVSINRKFTSRQWRQTHISIHLMFLLIAFPSFFSCSAFDFNTSHVSINLHFSEAFPLEMEDFNTSHVSINHFDPCTEQRPVAISIHLMFLLILAS